MIHLFSYTIRFVRELINMKIFIGLIHIGNKERDQYLIPKIAELSEILSKNNSVMFEKYSFEGDGPRINIPTISCVFRELVFWKEERRLKKFLSLTRKNILSDLARLRKHLRLYFHKSSRIARKRHFSVEVLQCAQHIRCYEQFCESGADVLLMFEDDAIFGDASFDAIIDVMQYVDPLGQNLLHVDLAGGISVKTFLGQHDGNFFKASRPVTNTTCSFIMSRKVVATIVDDILMKPWIRFYLPIDWLLNKLFIDLYERGNIISSYHYNESPLIHGSRDKYKTTWRVEQNK